MGSFAALLRGRAHELTRHLEAAVKGEVIGVHQGRVASRRLRESLPGAGRPTTALGASKSFRQITRALGPVRELDVAVAHLEQGLEGKRISRLTIERVRAHVLAERERRRERMLAQLERVDLEGALGRVERIAVTAPARVSDASAQRLARRVRGRALTLQRAIDAAGTLYHPDRLHAVRIAGKKLRYALEVAASVLGVNTAEHMPLLKRVQERLGLMHDYQVLLEHVSAVRDKASRGTRGAVGLRTMAVAYDRECRKLHAEYLKMAPGLAEAAAELRHLSVKVRNTRERHGRVVPGAPRHRR